METYLIEEHKKLYFDHQIRLRSAQTNEKIHIYLFFIVTQLYFCAINTIEFSTIDTEYLESLPESVRADIEAEIEKNKTDETSTLKRRPSSELYKYETVMEWEQFQRQRNEELNKSKDLDLIYSGQCSLIYAY